MRAEQPVGGIEREERVPVSRADVDTEVAKIDRADYERPEVAALVAQVEEQYRDRTPEELEAQVEAERRQALNYAVISKAAGDAAYRHGEYETAKGYYAEEAAFLEKSRETLQEEKA